MADLGLVIFEEVKRKIEDRKSKNLAGKLFKRFVELLFNAGFFKSRFGTKLYYSSRKNDFANGIFSYDLFENVKAWMIKLPFDPGTLFRLNLGFIMEYLERVCNENNIQNCLVPQPLREKTVQSGVFKDSRIPGKVLLKSLLIPVLEEIYSKAGMRIENLDLVIVSGDDQEELFTIVRLLEPYIKFVTILTANKGEIESRFSEIFSDSGLSFSISSEYKNRLKHADLIINMGKLPDIMRCRMPKKSLLINLYEPVESNIPGENTVLNDIVFDISGANVKNLMYELHGYYSKYELYGIIITHKLDLTSFQNFNHDAAIYIRSEFKKAGCRITGFAGRRGVISIYNVVNAIKL